MKKILFISTMEGYSWGGSEELWYRTAIQALSAGHSVMVLVKAWPTENEKIANLRYNGAIINYRDEKAYDDNSFFIKVVSKFEQAFRQLSNPNFTDIHRFRPDVVCISQGGTFDILNCSELINLVESLKVPYYLISQHNLEHGGVVPSLQAAENLEFIRGAQRFFFVSIRNHEVAERQLASTISNASYIDNPVNIITPVIKDFPDNETLLLANVARLECRYKGQDILLHALSDATWQRRNFRLHIFGAGPDKYYLEKLIRFYDLEDKVELKGHAKDIDELWKSYHALVLSSLSEGTPLSMLEAMLSGRAVIGTDVGDISKYVINGVTGFLCSAGSVTGLRESLESTWVNKSSLKLYGENAFHHASQIINFLSPRELLNQICKI